MDGGGLLKAVKCIGASAATRTHYLRFVMRRRCQSAARLHKSILSMLLYTKCAKFVRLTTTSDHHSVVDPGGEEGNCHRKEKGAIVLSHDERNNFFDMINLKLL